MTNQYVERAIAYFSDALVVLPDSEGIIAALKITTLGFLSMSHEFEPVILAIDYNERVMTIQLGGLPAIDVPDDPTPKFWFVSRWFDEGEEINSMTVIINWNQHDLDFAVSTIEDFFIKKMSYEELELKYQPFFPPD